MSIDKTIAQAVKSWMEWKSVGYMEQTYGIEAGKPLLIASI